MCQWQFGASVNSMLSLWITGRCRWILERKKEQCQLWNFKSLNNKWRTIIRCMIVIYKSVNSVILSGDISASWSHTSYQIHLNNTILQLSEQATCKMKRSKLYYYKNAFCWTRYLPHCWILYYCWDIVRYEEAMRHEHVFIFSICALYTQD